MVETTRQTVRKKAPSTYRRRCKNFDSHRFKLGFKVIRMFILESFLNKSSSVKVVDDPTRKISSKGVVTKEKTKLEDS